MVISKYIILPPPLTFFPKSIFPSVPSQIPNLNLHLLRTFSFTSKTIQSTQSNAFSMSIFKIQPFLSFNLYSSPTSFAIRNLPTYNKDILEARNDRWHYFFSFFLLYFGKNFINGRIYIAWSETLYWRNQFLLLNQMKFSFFFFFFLRKHDIFIDKMKRGNSSKYYKGDNKERAKLQQRI